MSSNIKGLNYIFIGLLVGTFTLSIKVNDPWKLYKFIMYSISACILITGFIKIIQIQKKPFILRDILILIIIYDLLNYLINTYFGGVINITVSIVFVRMFMKSKLFKKWENNLNNISVE